ncbi:hypothetical protein N657DRAFT_107951 [Parathielavia appendiculata]|uniref:Uncharacterized protein n=1 Tax=Parathielavia appendiculata TaxID=2587402 RepID=A0AAN6TVG9_9PEZI|nr:hypothetical protein N657DRAFT_107951 [Parathielavia appendiculata]
MMDCRLISRFEASLFPPGYWLTTVISFLCRSSCFASPTIRVCGRDATSSTRPGSCLGLMSQRTKNCWSSLGSCIESSIKQSRRRQHTLGVRSTCQEFWQDGCR